MNNELHHRWNAERDSQRGSNAPVEKDPQANVADNKVLLKQNKPR
jgi:hypothetical protein